MSHSNCVRLASLFLALGGIAGVSHAQQVLSAQSGTVHYTEGVVYLDGREIHPRNGQFATLKPGQELRTEGGRAEVLLTPGAFLRVADHSAVRMIDNRLSDTRVEVLEGTAIAECDALLKYNAITLLYAGNTIGIVKHGLYRIDTTAPAQLRVYDGEAIVESANGELTLKRGKETALNGALIAEKFNRKRGDGFDLWGSDRSALLAAASVNASQSMLNSQTPWTASGWAWSPAYNMFTFMPLDGTIFSPFGLQFWSPSMMSVYYVPYGSNRGWGGSGSTSASGVSSASSGRSGDVASFGGGSRGSMSVSAPAVSMPAAGGQAHR